MKENYSAYSIFIFLAFFWYSAHSQPFPTGDDFVVWDCDGEGFIQPKINLPVPATINSIQDSVGFVYPSDSMYTHFKFVFQFEDSLGNVLTIHYPVSGATSYDVIYDLKSLPAGATHTDDSTKKTLAFRLNAQYSQPGSGSFINVRYEVWGKNSKKGGSYHLLVGQTADSYYRRNLTCSKPKPPAPAPVVMIKNKRKGNFDQENVWISPNPFQDYIYLETNQEESILTIRDLQGRLIREMALPSSESRIRIKVDDLPAGLYIIQRRTSTSYQNIRMIKSR